MKVAVVTPYYKESPETLRRCLDSVAAQTHSLVRHYMVSDGHPRPDVMRDYPGVSCIDLPVAHADFGDTPRGVGALCALNEGADVICYLDADNLFESDHVASVVAVYAKAAADGEPLDAVFAYRHVFLPGHPQLRMPDPEDLAHRHVDTNCMTLARSAAFLWSAWAQVPKELSGACDRVMLALMRHYRLRMAWTGRHTVLYESNYSAHYRKAGLPVPATGLHDHALDDIRNRGRVSADTVFAHLRIRLNLHGSTQAGPHHKPDTPKP